MARPAPRADRFRLVFANSGYPGRLVTWAKTALSLVVQVVTI